MQTIHLTSIIPAILLVSEISLMSKLSGLLPDLNNLVAFKFLLWPISRPQRSETLDTLDLHVYIWFDSIAARHDDYLD